MSTSIVLSDVNLDDTRPNREGKIARFMERRERETTNVLEATTSSAAARSMIDVTFRMKENDMFADVKVFSFNLILSMDFLMKLSGFLQPEGSINAAGPISTDATAVVTPTYEQQKDSETRRRKSSFSGALAPQQEKKAVFAIHIEEYDVILVEKMDDINCLALILNVSKGTNYSCIFMNSDLNL